MDLGRKDDVDAPYGIDLDGDVDMYRDGDDEEVDDEEEDDTERKDEEAEEDEDEEEDEDGDNGKGPGTIGNGAMVNSLAEDIHTIENHQAIVLLEQGQEMPKLTPQP